MDGLADQTGKGELDINIVEEDNEKLKTEAREFVKEFPVLSTKQGTVRNHEV